MRLLIYIEQILRVDVGVPLRGGETGVAQQLLDGPEVSATLEKVGCKRVPERMGAGLGANSGALQAPIDDPPHGAIGEWGSLCALEKGIYPEARRLGG